MTYGIDEDSLHLIYERRPFLHLYLWPHARSHFKAFALRKSNHEKAVATFWLTVYMAQIQETVNLLSISRIYSLHVTMATLLS